MNNSKRAALKLAKAVAAVEERRAKSGVQAELDKTKKELESAQKETVIARKVRKIININL